MSKRNKTTIVFTPTRFRQYEVPIGGLPGAEPAAHALFHYYVTARSNWEREKTMIRYEHEEDDRINYRNLMLSISKIYNTTPERMVKFWSAVDFTCTLHNLPKLPDEERYRFNRVVTVQ